VVTRRIDAAAVGAIVLSTGLVALFTFAFVYPAHDPKPNNLPLAVVGDPGPLAAQGEQGEQFDIVRVDHTAAAHQAVLDREAYGAIIADRSPQFLIATAASPAVAQILTDAVPGARVQDVKPLDDDDPRGATFGTLGIALGITAILGALLLQGLAPGVRAAPRLALLAVFSVFGGLASMAVAWGAIGSLPGSYIALSAVTALGILAVAVPSAFIMRALGDPGILVAFLLFLMLGNSSSGSNSAPELLPDPWAVGGQFLPAGAMLTGLRNTAYFDGAAAGEWIPVLLVWAAIGTGLLLTVGRRFDAPEAAADGPPAAEPVAPRVGATV
jgi:hypothetical protein